MAYLGEAFDTLNNNDNNYQNIDYFFTQRNLSEDQEIIDKNMNRILKKKLLLFYNNNSFLLFQFMFFYMFHFFYNNY